MGANHFSWGVLYVRTTRIQKRMTASEWLFGSVRSGEIFGFLFVVLFLFCSVQFVFLSQGLTVIPWLP